MYAQNISSQEIRGKNSSVTVQEHCFHPFVAGSNCCIYFERSFYGVSCGCENENTPGVRYVCVVMLIFVLHLILKYNYSPLYLL